MKIDRRFGLVLLCLLIGCPLLAQENIGSVPRSAITPRTYLPGDLVHLVVGAPSNVVQVIAAMPDGQRLTLDFERRTHIWHGLWEVPYGFQKGDYTASLVATDVEGKLFEGKTNSFYIGEPALVTLIGLELTQEAQRQPVPPTAAIISKQPEVVMAHKPAAPGPQPTKQKIKPRKRVTRAEAVKLKAKLANDKMTLKFKLFTMARVHLTTQQFAKTAADLRQLLKLDPNNPEVKAMLIRVEKISQAKGAGR
jgi:hypothetical protein